MILMANNSKHTTNKGIDFKTTAQLFSGMDCWDTEIIHLSLQSVQLRLSANQAIRLNGIYRLNIPISGARGIGMNIEVTQINDTHFLAKWTQIDMESFAILKRTIELNSSKQNIREEIKDFANNGIKKVADDQAH